MQLFGETATDLRVYKELTNRFKQLIDYDFKYYFHSAADYSNISIL